MEFAQYDSYEEYAKFPAVTDFAKGSVIRQTYLNDMVSCHLGHHKIMAPIGCMLGRYSNLKKEQK